MATRKTAAKKTDAEATSAEQRATPEAPPRTSLKAEAAKKAPAKDKSARTSPAKDRGAKKSPADDERAKKTAGRAYLGREDLGAPVEVFFARQPPEQRELLETLHALVKRAAPDARASIKWGMPYYEMKRGICSLYTASTSYVGLNIMAPPEKLDDPKGKLEGKGKTMRHLKVRSAADIDEASILRWLKVAVAHHS